MTYNAQRFRDRARECRAIAEGMRDEAGAAMLEELADELDEEAGKIEAEDAAQKHR